MIARQTAQTAVKATKLGLGLGQRAFSSTPRALDLARVTLIGRLTSDPVMKSSERSGVSYVLYSVATNTGPLQAAPTDSERRNPAVNYHSVFSFNERANERLIALTKGSKVYVEADLQLKDAPVEDGAQRAAPTSFLTHRTLQLLAKPRSSFDGQEGEGEQQ